MQSINVYTRNGNIWTEVERDPSNLQIESNCTKDQDLNLAGILRSPGELIDIHF